MRTATQLLLLLLLVTYVVTLQISNKTLGAGDFKLGLIPDDLARFISFQGTSTGVSKLPDLSNLIPRYVNWTTLSAHQETKKKGDSSVREIVISKQPLIIPGQEHNTEDPIDLPSPPLKPDSQKRPSASKPEMGKLWRQICSIFLRSVVLLSRPISQIVHRELYRSLGQLNQFQRTGILSFS